MTTPESIEPTQPQEILYSDEAIDDWSQDLLARRDLVERLITSISSWPARQPLVVAITAPWGTGKTSLVNLLSKEFRARKHIVISFDPWFFNSSESLIQGFLTVLEERLKAEPGFQFSEEGRKAWTRVRRVLSSLPSVSLFGFGVDLSNMGPEAPSLDELRGEIAKICDQIRHRVIIVFDDLDRLASDDLRIALKLIKVWANFAPFTYVLAYDRTATEAKLSDEIQADPMLLQKLVQVEIHLPPARPTAIGRLIDKAIDEFKANYDLSYENDFSERLGEMWRRSLSARLTTLRDTKRYLNSVAFALPLVHGEVNYADLFAMEFVRLFYPPIYEQIRTHKNYFSGVSLEISFERDTRQRSDFYEQLLNAISDQEVRDQLSELLGLIFPLFQESRGGGRYSESFLEGWTRDKRAAAPDRFDTYFWLALPEGEVSDVWVRNIIQGVNESEDAESVEKIVHQALEETKQNGIVIKFFERLMLLLEEVAEPRTWDVIRSILNTAELLSVERPGFGMRSEYQTAGALIFALAARWQETDKIQGVLSEVVQNGPWGLASHIVHFANRNVNSIIRNFSHIDQERLRSILKERFRSEFATPNRSIFDEEPGWGFDILLTLEDKDLATGYLSGQFSQDPTALAPFLARLVVRVTRDPFLDLSELKRGVDVDQLRATLAEVKFPSPADEIERFALEAFFLPSTNPDLT